MLFKHSHCAIPLHKLCNPIAQEVQSHCTIVAETPRATTISPYFILLYILYILLNTYNTNYNIKKRRVIKMAKITTYTKETIHEDAEGNITRDVLSKTNKIESIDEPEYIKIYTNMWCEFNQIPLRARDLFLEIALRMTYACTTDKEGGQLFYAVKPINEAICQILGIKTRMYQTLLSDLVKCNAIRRVGKGVYQVNPSYAGKGLWKYNPRSDQGGIEDIIAKFSFKDKKVQTEIIFGDDGSQSQFNETYRQGLDVKAKDRAVLKSTSITNLEDKEVS